MLGEAFEGFVSEVQTIECCVATLQLGDDAQGLGVVVETAVSGHLRVQDLLTGMAEAGVAKVVSEGHRLGEILVEAQRTGECASELPDLDRVGEPGAVVVALVRHEHLRLLRQAAERGGVDDAVAIPLEVRPCRRARLRQQSAEAAGWISGVRRPIHGQVSPRSSSSGAFTYSPRGRRKLLRMELSARIFQPRCVQGRTSANRKPSWSIAMMEASTTQDVAHAASGATARPVDLTPSAARRVAEILRTEAAGSALRVGVDGGGCSGFQYTYDIVIGREADDLVLQRDGATVLIDPTSLELLQGAKIDFVNDLMGSAFKIHNPQATASCGCGVSFSI